MALGFVYACCPENELQRVKIGFTTQPDPVYYCHSHHGRTLCPLRILSVTGHCDARVAEGVIHLLLRADRVAEKHEIFNLSTTRGGSTGMRRLEEAVAFAQEMDSRCGLPVPLARDSVAERMRAREARAAQREEARKAVADRKRRRVAEKAQRETKQKPASKAEKAAAQRSMAAERARRWLQRHTARAESQSQFVRRSDLYRAFQFANKEERIPQTALGKGGFFHKALEELGEDTYKTRYSGQRDVFMGWSLLAPES